MKKEGILQKMPMCRRKMNKGKTKEKMITWWRSARKEEQQRDVNFKMSDVMYPVALDKAGQES